MENPKGSPEARHAYQCLRALVYTLLGKKERRRALLMLIHSQSAPPIAQKSTKEVWRLFIDMLLYAPVRITLNAYALGVLDYGARAQLAIPYEYLTREERAHVARVFCLRDALFAKQTFYNDTQYELSSCLFDKAELWPRHERLEWMRDFCILVCYARPTRAYAHAVLLAIFQELVHEKENVDWCIADFIHTLQSTPQKITDVVVYKAQNECANL